MAKTVDESGVRMRVAPSCFVIDRMRMLDVFNQCRSSKMLLCVTAHRISTAHQLAISLDGLVSGRFDSIDCDGMHVKSRFITGGTFRHVVGGRLNLGGVT